MTLQAVRRTVETPIRNALLALTPPIKPLTENESYTENTALSEFALLSLSFGLMAEPSIGCAMDEFIRASLVITIYTQKGAGPGRAQQAAQAVMTAIANLGLPTIAPIVPGVRAWPLGMSGPTFTPMDGRPHLATRITAPMQAKVEPADGFYPYFWGRSQNAITPAQVAADIASGSAINVNEPSAGAVSIVFNATLQFMWVAIPLTSTVKATWYNTPINTGSIGPDQFILAPVTQNVSSPSGLWTDIPYRIYISGYASTTVGAIELRN